MIMWSFSSFNLQKILTLSNIIMSSNFHFFCLTSLLFQSAMFFILPGLTRTYT